jgi:hypothetical protein
MHLKTSRDHPARLDPPESGTTAEVLVSYQPLHICKIGLNLDLEFSIRVQSSKPLNTIMPLIP